MPDELRGWEESLKRYLEQKTGRKDVEVTVGPYRSYDVKVSKAADHHPIVDFYSPIRWDPARVNPAVAYAVEMLQNWEAGNVVHDKAVKDSERFYAMLRARFPNIELHYNVIDSETHSVAVERVKDKFVASFDLWPKMTDADVERIADYIREHARKVVDEGATMSGTNYW